MSKIGRLLLALVLIIAAGGARAASCEVSATDVAFGSYNRLIGRALDTTGRVTVTCTGGRGGLLGQKENVSYEIQLSAGSSGSLFPRTMVMGADTLRYNLYTNAARGVIWGEGSAASTVSGGFSLGNCVLGLLGLICTEQTLSNNHTVYGRVPAGQNVPAGSYSDSITVTVNY